MMQGWASVLFLLLTYRGDPEAPRAIQHLVAQNLTNYVQLVANRTQPQTAIWDPKQKQLSVQCHEGYKYVTAKIALGLRYLVTNFNFSILAKVDADTQFCKEAMPTIHDKFVYAGVFRRPSRVLMHAHRGQRKEWVDRGYVKLFNRTRYAKYARGGGYVISYELIAKTLPYFEWLSVQQLEELHAEDAFVGLMVQRGPEIGLNVSYLELKAETGPHLRFSPKPCNSTSFVFIHKLVWKSSS